MLSTMLYVFFALYVAFAASENPDGKTCLYTLLSRFTIACIKDIEIKKEG